MSQQVPPRNFFIRAAIEMWFVRFPNIFLYTEQTQFCLVLLLRKETPQWLLLPPCCCYCYCYCCCCFCSTKGKQTHTAAYTRRALRIRCFFVLNCCPASSPHPLVQWTTERENWQRQSTRENFHPHPLCIIAGWSCCCCGCCVPVQTSLHIPRPLLCLLLLLLLLWLLINSTIIIFTNSPHSTESAKLMRSFLRGRFLCVLLISKWWLHCKPLKPSASCCCCCVMQPNN